MILENYGAYLIHIESLAHNDFSWEKRADLKRFLRQ